MKAAAIALALAVPAIQAAAQDVFDCDWQASARNIPEPWEAHSRSFSNGQTRLALLDTIEPAAGAFWLLVLSPPYSELGDRQCRVVGHAGMGFSGLDFARLKAGYDPARGLTFTLPGQIFEDGGFAAVTVSVTLNQATGAITKEVWR